MARHPLEAKAPADPQPGDASYVRLAGITKRFGDFTAVDDVSLDIRRGEIFCLLGGSGCGKTTLLRVMAGFERPSAGHVTIDGADMTGVAPYARPVNMMFQSYALFPHMSVAQNVAFGLRQESLTASEVRSRVAEMLELVQLTAFAARKPQQLSGGQQQRVALARSLVKRPKLLLLDEPLGALDKKLRETTQFELVNLQERLGVTFVVVTHDQQEAMTLAWRIGVMREGRIVQVGAPAEIYERPASRFVADFVGSVNLFEGRVAERTPVGVRVQSPALAEPLLVEADNVATGAQVWVAVRPEKIVLTREPGDASDNRLQGVVEEVAYLGEQSVYLLALPGGQRVRVTQPNPMRHTEGRLSWGDAAWLHWHASSGVLLTE